MVQAEGHRPVSVRRMRMAGHACFVLAKDILTGSRTVVLTDLADSDTLSPRNFMVVSTAMLIRGYGLGAADQIYLNLKSGGRKNEL